MNRNIAIILSANDAPLRHVLSGAAGYITAFEKSVEGASTRVGAFANAMKMLATAGVLALGVGLGYAAVQAVQFEKAMRNVNTVAHESESGLKAMSESVLQMSTELPQSADTLAAGLYNVASSGFYGADALQVLNVSAMAASAGLTETNTSAKAIVGVLNAYGLQASDAADVSDVLFKTVELGVLTFEDLAVQLGDVIGAAAAAKVPIDEVGSAIAAMTLAGLSAAESTVSLNRLLQKLIKPGKELQEALHNLGYESGEAALAQDGLHGVMEKLRLATGGQITELVRLFPEIRAARGAFALMANEGQNYQRVFDQITDKTERAGATQAAFNEQMKALGNQFTLFRNKLNVLAIEVGTALIPALTAALDFMQDFGSAVGRVLSDIAKRARPGIDAMVELFGHLKDIGQSIGSVLGPALRGLGGLLGAGLIGGFNALAGALAQLANVIAENETAIKIISTLLGGVLLSRLAQATAGFIAFHTGVRALMVWDTIGPILANITSRIGLLGSAFMNIAMVGGSVTTGLGQIRGAFAGLAGVLTSPVFIGTLAFAGFTAFMVGAQNAERQAKELRRELEAEIDFSNLASIRVGLREIEAELDRNIAKAEEYRNVGGFFKFVAETLTPMENGLQDAAAATDELNDAMLVNIRTHDALWSAQNQLMAQFDLTENEVMDLLKALDFDPRIAAQDTTGNWLRDLADAADKFMGRAENVTPAMSGMVEALETVGGVAATTTDKIEALKGATDSLFGVAINAREAEANLAEAIQNLGDTIAESGIGTSFDIWTEAGRENEQALRDNITAMIDLANATAAESGSVEAGVNVLQLYREQLLNNLTQMGMTREAAEGLIATYGLTPENLETLISLKGADEAQRQLQIFDETFQKINEAKAQPIVTLDDISFLNDANAVANLLIEIEKANPEATVYLNSEPFEPPAEMVMQWLEMYDDQSPEAMALLNVLDPEDKYTTLSELAASWGITTTSGTALMNNADVIFKNAMNQGAMAAWSRTTSTATANLQDNASPGISAVRDRLILLDGKSATVTINQITRAQTILVGSRNVPARWGGIFRADTGGHWEAQVLGGPTILAGERQTGGEALIPRLGHRARSLSILDQAASWYGMGLHPAGQSTRAGDVSINSPVVINVAAGADTTYIRREVTRAADEANARMLRQLRQELVAR